jgi:hypothetical protein
MSSTTTLPTDVGDDDTSADSEADPADDPADEVVPGDEP